MSFLDKAKAALDQAKDKATDLVDEHGDKIDDAIDKGGDFVDKTTKGKYSEHIDKAQGVAKSAADKLATADDDTPAPAVAVPDPAAPMPAAPPARPADEGGATHP